MVSRWRPWIWPLVTASLAAAVACSESEPTESPSTSAAGQGGSSEAGAAPGGSALGGTGQGGAQGGAGGSGGADCTGPCATQDLQASFGNVTRPLSRAVYGLTAPAHTSSGAWEIYLEAHEGGDPGCPTMASPTPLHTLVVAGLPAPLPAVPRSEADGVLATLLDFDGALLGATPLSSANTVTVTPTASSVCTACVGQGPDPSGYVAFDIMASFDEGTVTGHIYASHCESLDAP